VALRTEGAREGYDALVYSFPADAARRRARRADMLARRRRFLGVLAGLGLAGAVWWAAPEPGAQGQARDGAPPAVVVRSGDTVWDLAHRFGAPETDRRALVDAIVRLNGIDGPLQAGTRVLLPE
jgi:nucleoid-associated protein YgaU